jgi:cytoskeletal protein RodZ
MPKGDRVTTKKASSKKLNNEIPKPKFRVRFRPTTIIIALALMLLSASGIAYYIHDAMANKQLTIAPASNQSSATPSTRATTQPAQSTPTPTPQTPAPSNQQTANINSSKTGSSAPVTCQTEDIPYTTTTQYIANQYNTYSYDEGGINGSEMVCSDGTTNVYSAPFNKVHYVGAIDKAAQDLAAYNQIVAYCRSHNPSGGEITTCVDENLVSYDGYAAQSSTAAEAFINTLQ